MSKFALFYFWNYRGNFDKMWFFRKDTKKHVFCTLSSSWWKPHVNFEPPVKTVKILCNFVKKKLTKSVIFVDFFTHFFFLIKKRGFFPKSDIVFTEGSVTFRKNDHSFTCIFAYFSEISLFFFSGVYWRKSHKIDFFHFSSTCSLHRTWRFIKFFLPKKKFHNDF